MSGPKTLIDVRSAWRQLKGVHGQAHRAGDRQKGQGNDETISNHPRHQWRHQLDSVNLAPRKMRFGVSEGMVLAATSPSGVFVLSTDDRALPSAKVS
jgi:hypothetical protein